MGSGDIWPKGSWFNPQFFCSLLVGILSSKCLRSFCMTDWPYIYISQKRQLGFILVGFTVWPSHSKATQYVLLPWLLWGGPKSYLLLCSSWWTFLWRSKLYSLQADILETKMDRERERGRERKRNKNKGRTKVTSLECSTFPFSPLWVDLSSCSPILNNTPWTAINLTLFISFIT